VVTFPNYLYGTGTKFSSSGGCKGIGIDRQGHQMMECPS
jgi:hypothetical protein